MKKLIKYLSVIICSFMLFNTCVNAASYSVSVTSNNVTVGNTITLTINGSDLAGKFTISSSNTSVASLSNSSIWLDNNSSSITINTSSVGSATITITPTDVTGYDGSSVTGDKTVVITVKNKQTNNNSSTSSYVPPKKSSNNNLNSLTIDGYSLNTEFNKDTLEYSATIPADTNLIKINAQKADSTASITGVGEKEVKTGLNTFEIKVTAQNGNVKTYKLNVTVLESKKVTFDDKEYSIVEKDGILELINGYEKTTFKINNEEVVGYYNEITKYYLVILRDNEGKCNYYLYDNGKYSLYKEYDLNGVKLHLLDSKKPNNYVERELTINDDTIKAYQLDTNKKNTTYALEEDTISNYYLVYAMNVKTGNKNYYLIDKLENTVIRYDEELNNLFLEIKDDNNNYKTYFFITLGVLGIVIITFGITLIAKGKKSKNKFNF